MSIFYVFVINDPNNVGPYPPSISSSSWSTKIGEYFVNNNITPSQYGTSTINILQFEVKIQIIPVDEKCGLLFMI